MLRIAIHTCRHELFSAILSQYSFIRSGFHESEVLIFSTDAFPALRLHDGATINRQDRECLYSYYGPQSHLPLRFVIPQLLEDEVDQCLAIDPDVFCLASRNEILRPFDLLSAATPVCAREVRGGPFVHGYNSAVMYLDVRQLSHWNMDYVSDLIFEKSIDLQTLIYLSSEFLISGETSVCSLDPEYNSYDYISPTTRLLHCTYQSTQPWKAGMSKGGKYIDHILAGPDEIYGDHPSNEVNEYFTQLFREAYAVQHFDFEFLINEVRLGYVSHKLLDMVL